jgi:hypothetical protein
LQLDAVSLRLDDLREKLNAEGWLALVVEKVLDKPDEEASLTDTGIPDNDNFQRIIEFAAQHWRLRRLYFEF